MADIDEKKPQDEQTGRWVNFVIWPAAIFVFLFLAIAIASGGNFAVAAQFALGGIWELAKGLIILVAAAIVIAFFFGR